MAIGIIFESNPKSKKRKNTTKTRKNTKNNFISNNNFVYFSVLVAKKDFSEQALLLNFGTKLWQNLRLIIVMWLLFQHYPEAG